MDSFAEYGRQILSLVVVFSLLAITVWKLGRRRLSLGRLTKGFPSSLLAKVRSGERALETVERLVLTPQHSLHLLRWHDREMLVATHPQGCTLLEARERAAEWARGSGA